ncbi:MAG TPA: AI-2E family transporter [Thermoanaerobaculia bacterium]|nr:AI-2E family transporter [Thermoanaerobaculia bacterium]
MKPRNSSIDTPEPERQKAELRIPATTILKVIAAIGLAWAAVRILPEIFLLLLALLLALALAPAVRRLERRGLSRKLAVALVGFLILAVVGGVLVFVVPSLGSQITTLAQNYPLYRARVERRVSADYPVLARLALQIMDLPSSPEVAASLKRPLAWGRVAVTGVVGAAVLFVLVLYLLLDGKRVYAWLLAYVPRRHRSKMAQTLPEISDVVMAYVQGQFLISTLYGVFTLGVLAVLRVPAALPLALLAAICDVVPVLGVLVSMTPAALLAMTVSPFAGFAVAALYLLYHLLENSVIIPRVYGRRLRLSSLAVFVTLVLGVSLFGVAGVILLPIVAAYPAIERVWLAEHLSDEVIADHSALENAPESRAERVVQKVLNGEHQRAPEERTG